jgi:hypothetical protein
VAERTGCSSESRSNKEKRKLLYFIAAGVVEETRPVMQQQME